MPADPTPVDELAGKLKRTEIQRSASSIPGREIVQVRTEIPAGVASGSCLALSAAAANIRANLKTPMPAKAGEVVSTLEGPYDAEHHLPRDHAHGDDQQRWLSDGRG